MDPPYLFNTKPCWNLRLLTFVILTGPVPAYSFRPQNNIAMKTSLQACLLLMVFCLVDYSCLKTSGGQQSSGTGTGTTPNYPTDPDAIKTSVGTPIGSPTVKTIDASGGSLTSPDGVLELTIPAGALTTATAISIQPVANVLPNPIYNAYSLTPDGQQFLVPVTLQFHYRDEDLDTLDPGGVAVAFQLHDQTWEGYQDPVVDTVNKTITVQSTHFTGFGIGGLDHLEPQSATVKTGGQKSILHVTRFSRQNSNAVELAPIVNKTDAYGAHPGDIWTVNGSTAAGPYGSITQPTGNNPAIYTAPGKVPHPNIAYVRKIYYYKPAKGVGAQLVVRSRIKIVGKYKFTIGIYNIVKDSYVPGTTFVDSASADFELNPKDSTVNTIAIRNYVATCIPVTITVAKCTYTFQTGGTGPVNIDHITGSAFANGDNLTLVVVLYLTGKDAKWSISCSGGTEPVAPGLVGPYSFVFSTSVSDPTKPQQVGDASGNGSYVTLTAVEDPN
jgi:hypothetical protein